MTKKKSTITLTDNMLEHLFITMDGICTAGSEDATDVAAALQLAFAMRRQGLDCPRVAAWLNQGSTRYEEAEKDAAASAVCASCGMSPGARQVNYVLPMGYTARPCVACGAILVMEVL